MLLGAGKSYSQEQKDSTTKAIEMKPLNIDSIVSSPSENPISADSKHSNSSEKDSSKTKKNSIKNKLSKAKDKEIADNEKLLKDSAKKIPDGDIKQDVSNSTDSLKTKKDDLGSKLTARTSGGDSTKTLKGKAKDKLTGAKVAGVDMQDAKNLKKTDKDSLLQDKKKQIAVSLVPDSLPSKTAVVDGVKGKVKTSVADLDPGLRKQRDSLGVGSKNKLKNSLAGLKLKGTISAGYEYGFIPYVSDRAYPTQGFKTEGRVGCTLFKIPLEISYRYTTLKSTYGINNFFRVGYDASQYKDGLREMTDKQKNIDIRKRDSLQLQCQQIAMKQLHASLLGDYYSSMMNKPDSALALPGASLPGYSLPDTSMPGYTAPNMSGYTVSDTSRFGLNSSYDYRQKMDSLNREEEQYKNQYDSLSRAISQLNSLVDSYNKYPGSYSMPGKYGKLNDFFKNIKKLEVGLCNPSYSVFLVNNMPLKGINFEYSSAQYFFAFTYGTTVSRVLNPSTIDNTLNNARTLYNYFDFSDLSAGRKIISLKGGTGTQEGNHLYVGFLLGKGRTDYMSTSDGHLTKESNLVLEVDGKYKITPDLTFNIVAGKSSVQDGELAGEKIQVGLNEIFSNFRSNAIQGRLDYDLKRTRTKFTLSSRFVDPYFRSFGVGFMRSDNLRYEIKAEQAIKRSFKYTISYRREEDNLLRLYSYKSTLHLLSNTASLKVNRYLHVRLTYSPVFRKMQSTEATQIDRNQIVTGVLSFNPRIRKVNSNMNLIYSKYQISSDSGKLHFDNFTYNHQFIFEKGFKTSLQASWFKNSLKDTTGNDTYYGLVDVGYQTKAQHSFIIGGKCALGRTNAFEYGFLAKISVKIFKKLVLEVEAEKILVGDYYNSLIDVELPSDPYYAGGRLTYIF